MSAIVTAEFARPADTNAYAIGDIISNNTSGGVAMTFPAMQEKLTRVSLIKSTNAVTMTIFQLALYGSDPGVQNDNAAWALTYANRAGYLFTLTLGATAVIGAGGAIAGAELQLAEPAPLPYGTVYGVLIAGTAVALGNAETFSVRLHSMYR